MYGNAATPLFDEVARNFKEKEGYDMFTIIWTEGPNLLDRYPSNSLPEFDAFVSSFPSEWLVYHGAHSTSAQRIDMWNSAPQPVGSCEHDVSYMYACSTCDWGEAAEVVDNHVQPRVQHMVVDGPVIEEGVALGLIEVIIEEEAEVVEAQVEVIEDEGATQ